MTQAGVVEIVRGILFCAGLMALSGGAVVAESRTVLACQYVAASGLDWVGGKWVPQPYTVSTPFFLAVADGRLDPDRVGAVILDLPRPEWISCAPRFGSYEVCSAAMIGRTIFFDHDGMQGSVAYLGGSAQSWRQEGARDSLVVMPFVCQAM
jgi:hypothetical protein